MKTTIKGLALASIMMLGSELNAQRYVNNAPTVVSGFGLSSNDQDLSKLPKMDRDIVILQNVLNDLFKGSREGVFYSSRGAKGMYVKGKGVLFNFNRSVDSDILFLSDDAKELRTIDPNADVTKSDEELKKEAENNYMNLSKEFILNYGSIISELEDNEKIALSISYNLPNGKTGYEKKSGNVMIFTQSKSSDSQLMTSTIRGKDLKDFSSGKLTEAAASAKITTTIVSQSDEVANDTRIMAGILDDVFQSSFVGTFNSNGRTAWTYFEGFGLMFNMNFSSNRARELRVFYAEQKEEKEQDPKNLEAEKEETRAAFEKLIDLAKESLVTYGRTLRSVKSDEVIILNMNFSGGLRDLDLPKLVRIQVNKSQIEAFSKGSISLEQLKQEIDIKRLSSSTNNSEVHYFPASPSEVFDVAPARVTGRVKGQN